MTNPERSLSSALLVLPQRTSWHSLNLAKLRELCIAQSGDREENYIVELFWRFIGQNLFFKYGILYAVLQKMIHQLAVFACSLFLYRSLQFDRVVALL